MANHHDAGWDAANNVAIATHKEFWDRKTNKDGGVHLFDELFEGKKQKIKEAREKLRPDLSKTPWSYENKGIPSGGLPKYVAGSIPPTYGPQGGGHTIFDGVEDCFINQVGDKAIDYVVKCTNYYASEEPVKLVKKMRNRILYKPCTLGEPGQVWRCGNAAAKAVWKRITKWHVLMVFAVQLRAGCKRLATPLTLWVNYDDVSDEFVKKHVSKEVYLSVLKFLSFSMPADAAKLGRDGRPFKTRKVKTFLDILQQRARELYDPSQELGADEMCVLCKSRYCAIKQRNTTKPKRIHIKVYGLGDCNSGYLLAWKVYEGKGSGTLKEIIVDDMFPSEYAFQKRVCTLDNYFSGHPLSHGFMVQHGVYTVSTCKLSSRDSVKTDSINETDFPFMAQSSSTSKGLRRGFLLSAKATVKIDKNKSYTKRAKIWNDTKLVGIIHNCMPGWTDATTVTRRMRVGNTIQDSVVDAFEAGMFAS
jgi:hypothetical protein